MSYLEQAKRNKANAEKARAFEEMQAKQQAQQVYSTGQADAISAVERRLQQKAAEARLLDLQDVARNYGLTPEWVSMANSLTNKPDSYPLTAEDLGMIAPNRHPDVLSREAEALRSKGSGRLSFDDLGALSRGTSDDAYIDITPGNGGLANSFRER